MILSLSQSIAIQPIYIILANYSGIIFDEISRRSINFIRSCVSHESSLVSYIAQYAVYHARTLSSFLGQNVLFCMRRYNCSLRDLLYGPVNNIIKSFVFNLFDENARCSARFLFELIMIRNNQLCIGLSGDSFSYDEMQFIIDYVCTN